MKRRDRVLAGIQKDNSGYSEDEQKENRTKIKKQEENMKQLIKHLEATSRLLGSIPPSKLRNVCDPYWFLNVSETEPLLKRREQPKTSSSRKTSIHFSGGIQEILLGGVTYKEISPQTSLSQKSLNKERDNVQKKSVKKDKSSKTENFKSSRESGFQEESESNDSDFSSHSEEIGASESDSFSDSVEDIDLDSTSYSDEENDSQNEESEMSTSSSTSSETFKRELTITSSKETGINSNSDGPKPCLLQRSKAFIQEDSKEGSVSSSLEKELATMDIDSTTSEEGEQSDKNPENSNETTSDDDDNSNSSSVYSESKSSDKNDQVVIDLPKERKTYPEQHHLTCSRAYILKNPPVFTSNLTEVQKETIQFINNAHNTYGNESKGVLIANSMGCGKTGTVLKFIIERVLESIKSLDVSIDNKDSQKITVQRLRRLADFKPVDNSSSSSVSGVVSSDNILKMNAKNVTDPNPIGRTLVVCPVAVTRTWVDEFKKHSRGIIPVLCTENTCRKQDLSDYVVVVTTYSRLRAEKDFMIKNPRSKTPSLLVPGFFRYLVLDECQAIKNTETIIAELISELVIEKFKLLLSGTPMENKIDELYASFSVLEIRGLLPFKKFAALGFRQKVEYVGPLCKKFMIRKLTQGMPRLWNFVVPVNLGPVSSRFYEETLNNLRKKLPSTTAKKSSFKRRRSTNPESVSAEEQGLFLQTLSELRKICSTGGGELSCYNETHSEKNPQYGYCMVSDGTLPHKRASLGNRFTLEPTNKMLKLLEIIKYYKEYIPGAKFIIFTGLLSTVYSLRDFINTRSEAGEITSKALVVCGALKGDLRTAVVEKFKEHDSGIDYLCCITSSMSSGLNIQAAQIGVFFDDGLNPQQKKQGICRFARPGNLSENVYAFTLYSVYDSQMNPNAKDLSTVDHHVGEKHVLKTKTFELVINGKGNIDEVEKTFRKTGKMGESHKVAVLMRKHLNDHLEVTSVSMHKPSNVPDEWEIWKKGRILAEEIIERNKKCFPAVMDGKPLSNEYPTMCHVTENEYSQTLELPEGTILYRLDISKFPLLFLSKIHDSICFLSLESLLKYLYYLISLRSFSSREEHYKQCSQKIQVSEISSFLSPEEHSLSRQCYVSEFEEQFEEYLPTVKLSLIERVDLIKKMIEGKRTEMFSPGEWELEIVPLRVIKTTYPFEHPQVTHNFNERVSEASSQWNVDTHMAFVSFSHCWLTWSTTIRRQQVLNSFDSANSSGTETPFEGSSSDVIKKIYAIPRDSLFEYGRVILDNSALHKTSLGVTFRTLSGTKERSVPLTVQPLSYYVCNLIYAERNSQLVISGVSKGIKISTDEGIKISTDKGIKISMNKGTKSSAFVRDKKISTTKKKNVSGTTQNNSMVIKEDSPVSEQNVENVIHVGFDKTLYGLVHHSSLEYVNLEQVNQYVLERQQFLVIQSKETNLDSPKPSVQSLGSFGNYTSGRMLSIGENSTILNGKIYSLGSPSFPGFLETEIILSNRKDLMKEILYNQYVYHKTVTERRVCHANTGEFLLLNCENKEITSKFDRSLLESLVWISPSALPTPYTQPSQHSPFMFFNGSVIQHSPPIFSNGTVIQPPRIPTVTVTGANIPRVINDTITQHSVCTTECYSSSNRKFGAKFNNDLFGSIVNINGGDLDGFFGVQPPEQQSPDFADNFRKETLGKYSADVEKTPSSVLYSIDASFCNFRRIALSIHYSGPSSKDSFSDLLDDYLRVNFLRVFSRLTLVRTNATKVPFPHPHPIPIHPHPDPVPIPLNPHSDPIPLNSHPDPIPLNPHPPLLDNHCAENINGTSIVECQDKIGRESLTDKTEQGYSVICMLPDIIRVVLQFDRIEWYNNVSSLFYEGLQERVIHIVQNLRLSEDLPSVISSLDVPKSFTLQLIIQNNKTREELANLCVSWSPLMNKLFNRGKKIQQLSQTKDSIEQNRKLGVIPPPRNSSTLVVSIE